MITLYVKHDTKHRTWHKLSVGFHDAMSATKANMETLAGECYQYAMQYAVDHQMNRDQIAFRIMDKNDAILYEHESNATANRDMSRC